MAVPFHLDWVSGFLSLFVMYVVGKKIWWGWLLGIVNIAMFIYINTTYKLWGFLPANFIMLAIMAKNTWQWYVQRKGN
jgi:nicotinamide riboside transporter PnuC